MTVDSPLAIVRHCSAPICTIQGNVQQIAPDMLLINGAVIEFPDFVNVTFLKGATVTESKFNQPQIVNEKIQSN